MLGEKIHNLRKSKKISQEQLAELIGVSRQTISNWELGETSPNPDQLKLLSSSLNVSIDELLDNNVKSILVERVSNTERLAGIIIKLLKVIGVLFIIFFVIDIVSLILFTSLGKFKNEEKAITMCKIEDESYEIQFGTDESFKCDNCSLKMKKDLKKLVDFKNISKSMNNIEQYFINNNGICE